MAECEHRWITLDDGEPFCKLCKAKKSKTEEGKQIIECLHVGEMGATVIQLEKNSYMALCPVCWNVIRGEVLSELMARGMAFWLEEGHRRLMDGA